MPLDLLKLQLREINLLKQLQKQQQKVMDNLRVQIKISRILKTSMVDFNHINISNSGQDKTWTWWCMLLMIHSLNHSVYSASNSPCKQELQRTMLTNIGSGIMRLKPSEVSPIVIWPFLSPLLIQISSWLDKELLLNLLMAKTTKVSHTIKRTGIWSPLIQSFASVPRERKTTKILMSSQLHAAPQTQANLGIHSTNTKLKDHTGIDSKTNEKIVLFYKIFKKF